MLSAYGIIWRAQDKHCCGTKHRQEWLLNAMVISGIT